MVDEDQLVLNSISARALKCYFITKFNEMVDELVTKKYPQKKKAQSKRPETRIPIDLIKKEFVKKFSLDQYTDGVLVSLINSLVENNYFTTEGKLNKSACEELVLTETEKRILDKITPCSPLYIDISDVKTLSTRLKTSAKEFEYNNVVYKLQADKIEDLINQLVQNKVIKLDEKCSVKDSVYNIPENLVLLFKTRLFKSPQVKDNAITKTRLYDYFNRVTKPDETKIYVILKDPKIAEVLEVDTVKHGSFLYTKHSMLINAISSNVDRYSKKFQESFYEKIAEFIKDNEKVNVSKVIECLIVPNITLESF
ncbi:DNA-binding core protein [Eptesipox virus]|nr:DNA-binding core protein [Eptesipox virus]